MADPGIDRRRGGGNADFFKNLYSPQLEKPASYICSRGVRGHAPPENRTNLTVIGRTNFVADVLANIYSRMSFCNTNSKNETSPGIRIAAAKQHHNHFS